MQNTLNKRRPLAAYISTPGYNVETSPSAANMARNRKCESVFSVRSQRSRAAYSEMAYSEHRHSKHKHCSHRRSREHHKHGRRQSGCSHRHRDQHKYDYHKHEEDCLSADEFEEAVKHRRNRARSYHTLCDENDHKYFDEFDNETNCCARNRHNGRHHHRRKHRSCCLNELHYDSREEEENSFAEDANEETGSRCSSVHSLNKEVYCKRRHKQRKESQGSKLSLKMDQPKGDQIDEQSRVMKRSFKNLKLIDKLDSEELAGDQSDASDLSYCSHHSRRSRRSKGCHRSKSRCCRHSHRSSCGKHHHIGSDLLDYPQHERRRRKNISCESLSDDSEQQAMSEPHQPNNEPKLYRSNNQSHQAADAPAIAPHPNQPKQQLPASEANKFAQPINRQNHAQNASNQYLHSAHQPPNHQQAYEIGNQTDCRALPKYNTINYRAPIDTNQIPNFLTAPNYLPNYNTIAANFVKPMHFQSPAQFYQPQLSYQMRTNPTRANPMNQQSGMYLGNGLPVNSAPKNEQLIDLNQSKQQVYQNLQDYRKVNQMSGFENSQRPQLPPKNLTVQSAPPLPPCKPHLGTSKLVSGIRYTSQSEVSAFSVFLNF